MPNSDLLPSLLFKSMKTKSHLKPPSGAYELGRAAWIGRRRRQFTIRLGGHRQERNAHHVDTSDDDGVGVTAIIRWSVLMHSLVSTVRTLCGSPNYGA